MKEIYVKTYYPDYIRNKPLLVHQCANLLENESVILTGFSKHTDTSIIGSHKKSTGLQIAQLKKDELKECLEKGYMKDVLKVNNLAMKYSMLKCKLNFENIFVSNDDNISFKISLMEDKQGIYWEDEVCSLGKALDMENLQ